MSERLPPDDETAIQPPMPPVSARRWLATENPWPWLALVLVVVAGLLVWLLLLRGNGKEQTVPRAVGLRQQAAVGRLTRAGYNVTVVRASSARPADVVFAQRPGAGSRLKHGQTVTIDVSNGANPSTTTPPAATTTSAATTTAAAVATVPDVGGRSQADAGGAVEAAALVPSTYPVPSSIPAGTVVSQAPPPGTKLAPGRDVRLNVSGGGGSEPAVTVPDTKGKSAADARAQLWAAKLTVLTDYVQAADSSQVGIVLRQSTAGGQVPAYSQVTITVGR